MTQSTAAVRIYMAVLGGVNQALRLTESVGAAISGYVADIEAWAESDGDENDGITLQPADLTRYLIRQRRLPRRFACDLTEPLMDLYYKRLRWWRKRRKAREADIAIEQAEVDLVIAGFKPSYEKRSGHQRKGFCVNNHLRTPENLDNRSNCLLCRRARKEAEKIARHEVRKVG